MYQLKSSFWGMILMVAGVLLFVCPLASAQMQLGYSPCSSPLKSHSNPDSIPFGPPVNYAVGGGTGAPYSVFCVDLDGDTDLDLAVANAYSNNVSILFNRSITTDVPDGEDLYQRPQEYWLSQNYPNPFNSQTVIEYSLPQAGRVKIIIYNILGQRVKVLLDDRELAGYKSVIWDGTNQKGKSVASGIYLYRIEAHDFVECKEMLLLR